jgi:hypothetical protein
LGVKRAGVGKGGRGGGRGGTKVVARYPYNIFYSK